MFAVSIQTSLLIRLRPGHGANHYIFLHYIYILLIFFAFEKPVVTSTRNICEFEVGRAFFAYVKGMFYIQSWVTESTFVH